MYVPASRFPTVAVLDTPFVIVIVAVATGSAPSSASFFWIVKLYVPSASVPVVVFPFTVTFFVISRLPTSLLFTNAAVGTFSVLFAVTSTFTPFVPTRLVPFSGSVSVIVYSPGIRLSTCTSAAAPFVIVSVCVLL